MEDNTTTTTTLKPHPTITRARKDGTLQTWENKGGRPKGSKNIDKDVQQGIKNLNKRLKTLQKIAMDVNEKSTDRISAINLITQLLNDKIKDQDSGNSITVIKFDNNDNVDNVDNVDKNSHLNIIDNTMIDNKEPKNIENTPTEIPAPVTTSPINTPITSINTTTSTTTTYIENEEEKKKKEKSKEEDEEIFNFEMGTIANEEDIKVLVRGEYGRKSE